MCDELLSLAKSSIDLEQLSLYFLKPISFKQIVNNECEIVLPSTCTDKQIKQIKQSL